MTYESIRKRHLVLIFAAVLIVLFFVTSARQYTSPLAKADMDHGRSAMEAGPPQAAPASGRTEFISGLHTFGEDAGAKPGYMLNVTQLFDSVDLIPGATSGSTRELSAHYEDVVPFLRVERGAHPASAGLVKSFRQPELTSGEPGLPAPFLANENLGQRIPDAAASGHHARYGSTPQGTKDAVESAAGNNGQIVADALPVRIHQEPVLTSIDVSPASISIMTGGSQTFAAQGFDQSGRPMVFRPAWSATGGSIDDTGLFEAESETGMYQITATDGAVSGATTVFVTSSLTWPTNGWETATPAEMQMDAARLADARDYALNGGGSGMITRAGKLVMSWGSLTTRYDLKSTTKSIGVSTLGLALMDNLVGINDAAQLHLPSIGLPPQTNAATGWLDDITLLHLATHTAGFAKDGGYTGLLFQPGTAWEYSNGGANWLADVFTVKYGTDLRDLLFGRIFSTLGIQPTDLTWRNNAYREQTLNGVARREFGSGIFASVDAMARIGYLYLRNGTWDGEPILPPSFVQQASQPLSEVAGLPVLNENAYPQASDHYGLLWWNNGDGTLPDVPRDAYWSWGLFESVIVVIPSLDIVASRAGSGWRLDWDADYDVVEPFLTAIAQSVLANRPTNDYLQFDGSNDLVTAPDHPALDITSRITLEAWIRPDTVSSSAAQDRIIHKNYDYELTISTGDNRCDFGSGHVQWRAVIGGRDDRLCGGVLSPGTWQHIAGTYDGQKVVLYVNGAAVASAARSGTIRTNNLPLVLGNRPQGDRPFDGSLDEVRVWNRALTAAEIVAGRNTELQGDEAGLIAYYRFNEGSGQTANDDAPTANHGTLGNSPNPDNADPQFSIGTVGSLPKVDYLHFDGDDDVFTVSDSPALDLTSAITVESWVRIHSLSDSKAQDRVVNKDVDYELTLSSGDTGCSFGTNGDVQWRTTVGGSNRRICGGVLRPGVWQHLAATYDGSKVILYIDGLPVASAPRSGPIATNNLPLLLGNRKEGDRPFHGDLDEVRIWNRALSAAEIAANRDTELNGNEPGLAAYFRLNEGSGQAGHDDSGSANHGVLGNSVNPEPQDPRWNAL